MKEGARLILSRVRDLASKSSDSSLAEASLILATAFEETHSALERVLSKIEEAGK